MEDVFRQLRLSREITMIDDVQVNPCPEILKRAEQFYKQPLKDLQLKAPIPVLYSQSDTEEPIGIWVTNIPKPGDIAACIKPPKRIRSR